MFETTEEAEISFAYALPDLASLSVDLPLAHLIIQAISTFGRFHFCTPPPAPTQLQNSLLCSLFPFFLGAVHTSNRIIRDGDDNGSGSATSQRNQNDDEKTFLFSLFLSFLPCSVFLLGH